MPNLTKLSALIILFLTLNSCTPEAIEGQEPTIHLENPDIYLEDGTGEDVPVDDKKN